MNNVEYIGPVYLVGAIAAEGAGAARRLASGGPATSLHVAIEVLRLATKIDINYVPYGGTAPAMNALLGGHVQAVWAEHLSGRRDNQYPLWTVLMFLAWKRRWMP